MSISMVCSLVVLLLFVSTHACNGRQLGAIKKDSTQIFRFPDKKNERLSIVISVLDPSNAQDSGSNSFDKASINKDFPEAIMKAHDEEHYPMRKLGEIQEHENGVISSTISLDVPKQMKKEEKQEQPGFNLDYSLPKTHPPSHY